MTSIHVPRFWYREAESFELTPEGFLVDPQSRYGLSAGTQAIPLQSLRGEPLLVLIGEPGIGKTVELDRIKKVDAEGAVCAINLATINSEDALWAKLERQTSFVAWRRDSGILELFLGRFR